MRVKKNGREWWSGRLSQWKRYASWNRWRKTNRKTKMPKRKGLLSEWSMRAKPFGNFLLLWSRVHRDPLKKQRTQSNENKMCRATGTRHLENSISVHFFPFAPHHIRSVRSREESIYRFLAFSMGMEYECRVWVANATYHGHGYGLGRAGGAWLAREHISCAVRAVCVRCAVGREQRFALLWLLLCIRKFDAFACWLLGWEVLWEKSRIFFVRHYFYTSIWFFFSFVSSAPHSWCLPLHLLLRLLKHDIWRNASFSHTIYGKKLQLYFLVSFLFLFSVCCRGHPMFNAQGTNIAKMNLVPSFAVSKASTSKSAWLLFFPENSVWYIRG